MQLTSDMGHLGDERRRPAERVLYRRKAVIQRLYAVELLGLSVGQGSIASHVAPTSEGEGGYAEVGPARVNSSRLGLGIVGCADLSGPAGCLSHKRVSFGIAKINMKFHSNI